MYTQSMFWAKIRKISKFSFFTTQKKFCILHGQVFIMSIPGERNQQRSISILPTLNCDGVNLKEIVNKIPKGFTYEIYTSFRNILLSNL